MSRIPYIAAGAAFAWVALQTVATRSTEQTWLNGALLLNNLPVAILGFFVLQRSRVATVLLGAYGLVRVWMAIRMYGNAGPLPEHAWIAFAALPFACAWFVAALFALRQRAAS